MSRINEIISDIYLSFDGGSKAGCTEEKHLLKLLNDQSPDI